MPFENLADLFAFGLCTRLHIQFNIREAATLYTYAKNTTGDILEIGRMKGGTLALLSEGAQDSNSPTPRTLISIDINPKAIPHPKAQSHLDRNTNVIHKILTQSSHLPLDHPPGFGLILVDGDHGWNGVQQDILTHWDSLHHDGICVFHDYGCTAVKGSIHRLYEAGVAEGIVRVETTVVVRKKSPLPSKIF